jgi:molecular chaperone GrpE
MAAVRGKDLSMESPSDRSMNGPDAGRGAPGSEDAFARGAGTDAPVTGEIGGPTATAGDDAVEGGPATVEDMRRQLDEQRDKYLRLAAEFDNFRRRTARERQDAMKQGMADMVRGLIDALDDIARFAHVDPATVDASTVVEGVDMVERKLMKSLAGHGLEVVNPVDHPFDPALHEAVATEPALSSEDDHIVARVYQPGYVFNGQLLRPARVVVKQWNG